MAERDYIPHSPVSQAKWKRHRPDSLRAISRAGPQRPAVLFTDHSRAIHQSVTRQGIY